MNTNNNIYLNDYTGFLSQSLLDFVNILIITFYTCYYFVVLCPYHMLVTILKL